MVTPWENKQYSETENKWIQSRSLNLVNDWGTKSEINQIKIIGTRGIQRLKKLCIDKFVPRCQKFLAEIIYH